MAGLWEHCRGDGPDRFPMHWVTGAVTFYVNSSFTNVQLRDSLNATIAGTMDAQTQTDLLAIGDAIAALNAANRGFQLHVLEATLLAAEGNEINEATFRSILGITLP